MDHNILISKLSAYGISGTSIEWFKSHLSERNQKCFLNGSLSSNRVLSCGIPQGTILGPLLFPLYINDLPNCLMHSQPRMYADDTYLTLAGNSVDSIELNLNEDLASVSRNGPLLCVQFVFTTLNNCLLFLVALRELSRELRIINYNLRKILGVTN